MKLFYVWLALAVAGGIVSIVLFSQHKNFLVLLISLAMCCLTATGLIKTTKTSEDQKRYLSLVITSFLGCLVIGGYITKLAFSQGSFINTTITFGFVCLPILFFDKGTKEVMGSLLGESFRQMFTVSSSPEGCLTSLLVGMFSIVLTLFIGVLFMFLAYISATFKLISANVAETTSASDVIQNTSENKSDLQEDNGDWL